MKSQANGLLHVLQGVLTDASVSYPHQLRWFSKDSERLAQLCESRGLGLFTLDLPSLDDSLLRALEVGRLVLSGPVSRQVSKKTKVPRLFSGLWLRVFHKDARLRVDADVTAIAFLRQLCCLGKKYAVDCSPKRLKEALEDFHDTERKVRAPSKRWKSDILDPRDDSNPVHICDSVDSDLPLFQWATAHRIEKGLEDDLRRIQQVADFFARLIGPIEPATFTGDSYDNDCGARLRHGRGAVAVMPKNGYKYSFENWTAKLNAYFPFQIMGRTAGDQRAWPRNHEVASRLCAVPKTLKGPRLIATEPLEHQWCQQLILNFLEGRFRDTIVGKFITLRRQDLSADLVVKASLDRSLCTVDLSSASDRLSCWLVERLLRQNKSLLNVLHASRTRYVRDDITGEFVLLNKFATQGTAVTFPIQSLVFLCIAIGVSIDGECTIGKIRRLVGHVRVYGDDIIIANDRYDRVTAALHYLGLKVNDMKSFHKGHFRESCGANAYRGYDVTPVRLETVTLDGPEDVQSMIDGANNLFLKGYWRASDALMRLIPFRIRNQIRIQKANVSGSPTGKRDLRRESSGSSGVISFSGSDHSHLKSRWNSRLQRDEVRSYRLSEKAVTTPMGGYESLLEFFTKSRSSGLARTTGITHNRGRRFAPAWEPLYPSQPSGWLPG